MGNGSLETRSAVRTTALLKTEECAHFEVIRGPPPQPEPTSMSSGKLGPTRGRCGHLKTCTIPGHPEDVLVRALLVAKSGEAHVNPSKKGHYQGSTGTGPKAARRQGSLSERAQWVLAALSASASHSVPSVCTCCHHTISTGLPALPLSLPTTLASANAGFSPSHSWDRTPIGRGSLGWTGHALGPTAAPPVKGLIPLESLGVSTDDLSLTRGFDVCLPVASLCQARIYFGAPCFW